MTVQQTFSHEAPDLNSALIIYTSGAKCRDWEHRRALMTDCLQHFDKMKRHVPMIHLYNDEEALDS